MRPLTGRAADPNHDTHVDRYVEVRMSETKTRKVWRRPRVECLETRPEVTAYAGDSGPWNHSR
jgi:hypothetical protein